MKPTTRDRIEVAWEETATLRWILGSVLVLALGIGALLFVHSGGLDTIASAMFPGMSTPATAPADTTPQGDDGTAITEVRLSDGTRCAVMDANNGKALSCDWKASR